MDNANAAYLAMILLLLFISGASFLLARLTGAFILVIRGRRYFKSYALSWDKDLYPSKAEILKLAGNVMKVCAGFETAVSILWVIHCFQALDVNSEVLPFVIFSIIPAFPIYKIGSEIRKGPYEQT